MEDICVIIPARYKSKRLPGKPLIKIHDKELLLLTYEKAKKTFNSKDIYIFTDSKKVLDKLKEKIPNIFLFKKNFKNGTERASYGLQYLKKKYKAALLISCDNPFITTISIKTCIKAYKLIKKDNDYFGSTIHTVNKKESVFNNKNIAKIVINQKNDVMYISRSPIPYNYKIIKNFRTHHGPVCIKLKNLKTYSDSSNTPLQIAEDNEWLKIMEKGFKMKSLYVKKIFPEINTIKDLNEYKKKRK